MSAVQEILPPRVDDISDTIEVLGIREPLPVGNFGTVFWERTYLSGKSPLKDEMTPDDLLNMQWEVHYGIPWYGGLSITLKTPEALRAGGRESVGIYIDYAMSVIEREYYRDGNQDAKITDLSIPNPLIKRMEQLLREWSGEELRIFYAGDIEDDDPTEIYAEFVGCEKLPTDPDTTLQYIAQSLTDALAT